MGLFQKSFYNLMTKLAVVGNPVFHSLSPYVFSVFNKDKTNSIKYNRVSTPNISDAIQFAKELKLDGFNVTAPYKYDVLEHIDKIDYQASNLNSSNTVKILDNNTMGFNTDYFGILKTIWDNNVILNKQKVLILGAGSAGRTAAFAVRNLNSVVYVWDRNYAKSKKLSNEVGVRAISTDELISEIGSFQYIVSTIPYSSEIFEVLQFSENHTIFDTIYHKSYFKENQNKYGYKLIPGEKWLINQAILSNEIFIGQKPNNIPLVQDLEKQKSIKSNSFVLIGFSGSGKTNIGSEVARNLDADFYDIDQIIETQSQTTINQIFEQQGESYFRQKENEILISINNKINSNNRPSIISTGGGILSNPINIEFLKQLGFVIWMYVPLEISYKRIESMNNRPLIKNLEEAKRLFDSRKEEYFQHSDGVFINTSNHEEAIQRLTNEIIRLM